MRILGIDPGLNVTGYGVVDFASRQPKLVEAGIVRSGANKSLADRIHEVHQGVAEVIEATGPQALAIEELYSHYERPRTAILMGHARGAIILAAKQAGMAVSHYAATQIKKTITDNGRAPKHQIQEAIARELGLPEPPDPPDVADALAVALTHCYLSVRQLEA